MNKKKICLFLLVALVSVFAFNASVSADIYCAAVPDAKIDDSIPNLVSTIIKLIQIVVPIILVVLGLFDFAKAVMAQKEDEIKKGQQTFIKRIIAAALVFFVVAIVKLLVSLLAVDNDIMACFDCFLYGAEDDKCTKVDPNASNSNSNSNTTSNSNGL